ncbi:hypothetical protein F5Y10DRAFT_291774 [Nemania abortiva]|nr:hypothetical protein F5Y10DRAFT_291774 [Nemania abortiva]
MGFIPQQLGRYPRPLGPRDPIVSLPNEYSTTSSIHDYHGPMALHELEKTRPYSVPSGYTQRSDTDLEQSFPTIPRPTSVAHTDTQRLFEFNQSNLNPLPGRNEEQPGPSSCKGSIPIDPSLEDQLIPPKRILPFPTSKRAKAQTTTTKEQLETSNAKSRSLGTASPLSTQVNQCTTSKVTTSRETTRSLEMSAPQLRSSKRLADREGEKSLKCTNDASAGTPKASKRRIKINVVNRHADHLKPFSRREHNASTPASPRVSEYGSQGSKPSQITEWYSKSDGISESLDPINNTSSVNAAHTSPLRARELSQLHPTSTDQDMGAEKASVTPSFAPEHSDSNLIDPMLFSVRDWNSELEISQESLLETNCAPDKPLNLFPTIPARPAAKRSASQATTVSGTNTEPYQAAGDEDVFNPMSRIDETMVLERDISDIVSARLQEGNPDSLETLQGEILIKMAVKDDEIFEAVSKLLQD